MAVSQSELVTQALERPIRRLFGFQWFMAIWERTAPYNAATLIEVSPDLSVPDIESRWQGVLQQLKYANVPISIVDIWSDNGTEADLKSVWLTHELCRPFEPDEVPFRLTVIRSPKRIWIRLGYRHIFTDGWTIALIVKRLLGTECPGAPSGSDDPPRIRKSLFQSISRMCSDFLRSGYPERRSTKDRELITDAAVPLSVKAIQSLAMSHQVTLNDAILGTVADAIEEVKPNWTSKRRPHTLIQVPVNVRRPVERFVVGQFIGSWMVSVPKGTYSEKLRAVCDATTEYKYSGEAFYGQKSMDIIGSIARWGHTHFANWVGRKVGPLAAIISNLNLSRYFSSESRNGEVLSYTRTASPGELAPLVVTVTSLGDTLDLRATAWTNSVNAAELRQIVEAIERRIGNQRCEVPSGRAAA
ncbi:MAG: hypothetical protein DWH81_11425 [Planctomycetota bacterium]|nr:MAG: hypothetical protein DWH81_11425 [Planctomycetota bacterium]